MKSGPSHVPADLNRRGPRITALDAAAVERIRRQHPKGIPAVMQLAREYEVSTRTIYRALRPDRFRCCCGLSFKHAVQGIEHLRVGGKA